MAIMFECPKYGCTDLVEPNDHYCPKHEKELQDKAMALYGSNSPPTILVSGGGVSYKPSNCERCDKTFRLWRKECIVFDRVYEKFLFVCSKCIKMTDSK